MVPFVWVPVMVRLAFDVHFRIFVFVLLCFALRFGFASFRFVLLFARTNWCLVHARSPDTPGSAVASIPPLPFTLTA